MALIRMFATFYNSRSNNIAPGDLVTVEVPPNCGVLNIYDTADAMRERVEKVLFNIYLHNLKIDDVIEAVLGCPIDRVRGIEEG